MGELATSCVLFAALWAVLRIGSEAWSRNKLPGWLTPIGGVVAWACVLSMAGPFIAVARMFLVVMERPSVAVAFQIGGVAILGSIAAKVLVDNPEILAVNRVKPFLIGSLMFQRYGTSREDIFAKAEQREIEALYKEQTGKNLSFAPKGGKPIREISVAEARREIEEARKLTARSIHLKSEVDELIQGKEANITEGFKINVMRFARHRLYEQCSDVIIDPVSKVMRFRVRFPELTAGTELTRERMFRVYQDLYEALQFLNMEHWMKPYEKFVETFSVTCHRVEADSFDLPQQVSFMTVEIPTIELRRREKTVFIATELPKIAKITMTQGKNIL